MGGWRRSAEGRRQDTHAPALRLPADLPTSRAARAAAALEGQAPPCELSGGHTWPEVGVGACHAAALRAAALCMQACCACSATPGPSPLTWRPALQVVQDSLTLHRIASGLRARRFDSGALRLDNTRLYFQLDGQGNPVDYGVYEQARCVRCAVCAGVWPFPPAAAHLPARPARPDPCLPRPRLCHPCHSAPALPHAAEGGQPAGGRVHAAGQHDHRPHGGCRLPRQVRGLAVLVCVRVPACGCGYQLLRFTAGQAAHDGPAEPALRFPSAAAAGRCCVATRRPTCTKW